MVNTCLFSFIFLSILVGSCLSNCSDTNTSSSSRTNSSYLNDYERPRSTYQEKNHTIYADNGESVTYNDSKTKIIAEIWYHNETEAMINEFQAKGYRIIINESPFPPQYDSNYKSRLFRRDLRVYVQFLDNTDLACPSSSSWRANRAIASFTLFSASDV